MWSRGGCWARWDPCWMTDSHPLWCPQTSGHHCHPRLEHDQKWLSWFDLLWGEYLAAITAPSWPSVCTGLQVVRFQMITFLADVVTSRAKSSKKCILRTWATLSIDRLSHLGVTKNPGMQHQSLDGWQIKLGKDMLHLQHVALQCVQILPCLKVFWWCHTELVISSRLHTCLGYYSHAYAIFFDNVANTVSIRHNRLKSEKLQCRVATVWCQQNWSAE